MITIDPALARMSHAEVLAETRRLAAEGRAVLADLLALLGELDERRLYEAEGCASLFAFCVERLRLSESQAYHRIQAARAARRFPIVLERVRDGRLTLTAIALLRPHLTDQNQAAILDWANGKRKAEIETFIRALDPRPDVRPSVRRLASPRVPAGPSALGPDRQAGAALPPSPSALLFAAAAAPDSAGDRRSPAPAAASVAEAALSPAPEHLPPRPLPPARAEIHALSPARYSLQVTISEETRDKLRRAQDLMRHTLRSADPAVVLDCALTLLVEQLERRKFAATKPKPRAARGAATRPARAPATEAKSPATEAKSPVAEVKALAAEVKAPAAQSQASRVARQTPRTHAPGRAPSRYVPAAVRREVWTRDAGRCGFVSADGVRCRETGGLEFHHVVPFAEGGAATAPNLSLRCAAHNGTEARRWFGEEGWSGTARPRCSSGAGSIGPASPAPGR